MVCAGQPRECGSSDLGVGVDCRYYPPQALILAPNIRPLGRLRREKERREKGRKSGERDDKKEGETGKERRRRKR
jgi:hypothetical protein